MENDYLYKDLNYEINGCAFDAFKEVGGGFDEPTYHKFFHQHLLDKGLKARYKVPLEALYRHEKIADFEADEIVMEFIGLKLDAKFKAHKILLRLFLCPFIFVSK